MKSIFVYSIFSLIILSFLFSCGEDDNFSSSSNLGLEYSVDTKEVVSLDTVFTTIVSPMRVLKVYNRNSNSISINSIKLKNSEKSGFRINVDGQAGTEFENVDLLKKDSLYIRIDVKAKEGKSELVEDVIELSWNGNTEYIKLEAYKLDAVVWDEHIIENNTHLAADKAYYVRGKLTIKENTTVTVEKGAVFYFDQKGALDIKGTFVANGTADKRITLRGHRFDLIERNIPYDNASGQWEGVTVGEHSFGNEFVNVNIRNSKKGINFLSSTSDKKKATLLNSIVHNTSEYGMKAENCDIDATNCQFSNSTGALVDLSGGKYTFLHCTIANYYRWHPRSESAVRLSNNKLPFSKCEFYNSIIVGTFKDEVDLLLLNKDDKAVRFFNCLIQSPSSLAEDRFVDTIWNIETVFLFKDLNSDKRYFYSFELLDDSKAINAANILYAQKMTTDLRGISRFSDSKPDIGCYEWSKSE